MTDRLFHFDLTPGVMEETMRLRLEGQERMDAARRAAQVHSDTSMAAAVAAVPAAKTQRHAVWTALLAAGPMTDEQIQHALSMNPSTERPRRVELVRSGLVRDSGQRAKTSSGRLATVWVAVRA